MKWVVSRQAPKAACNGGKDGGIGFAGLGVVRMMGMVAGAESLHSLAGFAWSLLVFCTY